MDNLDDLTEADGVDLVKPREACGVFGVFAPGSPVAHMTYLGLYALQHRGQESAGLAVSDGSTVTVVKDMGLVAGALEDRILVALEGDLAIGHTRYSTTGSSSWRASQPFYRDVGHLEFALGHNGNLVNTAELAGAAGMLDGMITSDSDLVAELVAAELLRGGHPKGRELEAALTKVLPTLRGGFSFVVMDQHHLIAVRDPNGFWPLALGRLDLASGKTGWVVGSETPALDTVGAEIVREIDPGEMVIVDRDGCRSERPFEHPDPKLCVFEFVYFSRPDSVLYGQNVHAARQRMGEQLSDQAPVEADLVMAVPESGIPAAQGYSRASGIAYRDGLVKNRYIGRTFIAPTQEMRALGVRMKLNPIRSNIEGQRLIVVDDSIVRGTTTRAIVQMLRAAGAAEVHLRISSPPYRWPCFYGMDTGTRGELLAANLNEDEICDYIGADSLAYLTLDRLLEATGADSGGFCAGCLTGDYPVEIPASIGREVLGTRQDDLAHAFVSPAGLAPLESS
ncbi:MAG: amidophosphoribosyltransferase [Acidimicrobiales bacterium]|jgi:amidophosphoribosyltransferase